MAELQLISADSHVNEPPNLWAERIDRKFRNSGKCLAMYRP